MFYIEKTFGEYPFAHRQHTHDGHCRFVHGHNWRFTLKLTAKQLDENGFIYDFGKFKTLKSWFNNMFDHTILINDDDPLKNWFLEHKEVMGYTIFDIRIVPSGSAENLAEFIAKHVQNYLLTSKAKLVSVTVHEDNKNSATYVCQD